MPLPSFLEKVRQRVKAALPAFSIIAAATPTKVDDVLVSIVEVVIDDEVLAMIEDKIRARLEEKGITL